MDTQQPVRRKRPASSLLMALGSILMLLALIGALVLYIWGRASISAGGEQWNDLVSIVYILFVCLPVFGIGLILLCIGAILNARRAFREKP